MTTMRRLSFLLRRFVVRLAAVLLAAIVIGQFPCPNSVITMESTYAAWTSHEEFFGFMKEFPKYEIPVRTLLGEFLKVEVEHAKLLRISSAKERYEALFKLRPEVIKRVPQIYIASYLGMSPETLSRVRAGKL